jgi:hypothetical protein
MPRARAFTKASSVAEAARAAGSVNGNVTTVADDADVPADGNPR